jgi:hypothetical protein
MAAQCREVLGSHATICSGRRADRYEPTHDRGSLPIRIVGYWLWLGSVAATIYMYMMCMRHLTTSG